MRAVGIKILKNRLSEYVRLAASGESVLVTDRDRVVAQLGPPPPQRADTPESPEYRAPNLHIWTMCFALFGIQIVWGLQNANTSRIFQALGADVAALAVAGVVGYFGLEALKHVK